MTQQEFLDAVKKQQSLIRKIMSNRSRRSECIQEAAQERYKHLVGKFFIANKELKGAADVDLYYVYAISTESNYVDSDKVVLCVNCKGLYNNFYGKQNKVASLSYCEYSFYFPIDTDLDARFAQIWVTPDRASNIIHNHCKEFCKSFISKK